MRGLIGFVLGLGLCASAQAQELFPLQKIPVSTQVPPPPALQGTVHHITAGSGDQTGTIQSAINAASGGDTIFFDQASHSVCGTVNLKAGQLYVGPSVTYPLLGQATRATIDGCNYAGTLNLTDNVTLYGLTVSNMASWVWSNTTGMTITNIDWDQHSVSSGPQYFCNGGDTNTTIQWSSFHNSRGINNVCGAEGGGTTNYLFTHNFMENQYCDAIGTQDNMTTNEIYSFNHFVNSAAIGCPGGGTGGVELQGEQRINGPHVTDNYFENIPNGFAISVVGSGTGTEVARTTRAASALASNGMKTSARCRAVMRRSTTISWMASTLAASPRASASAALTSIRAAPATVAPKSSPTGSSVPATSTAPTPGTRCRATACITPQDRLTILASRQFPRAEQPRD